MTVLQLCAVGSEIISKPYWFLASYDPYGEDAENFKIGGGTAIFTNNLRQAFAFDDFAELLDFVVKRVRSVRCVSIGSRYEHNPADVARVLRQSRAPGRALDR